MTRLKFVSAAKSDLTKKLLLLDYDPDEPVTRHNALHHKLTEDVIASLQKYKKWWPDGSRLQRSVAPPDRGQMRPGGR